MKSSRFFGKQSPRTHPLFAGSVFLLLASSGVESSTAQCYDTDEYISVIEVPFSRHFEGTYRHGEPFDVVTIRPDGGGETFADAGIEIRVRLLCQPRYGGGPAKPIQGLPAEQIILFSYDLCLCSYKTADGPTDSEGWTTFSGSIAGGGCTESLTLWGDGIYFGTIPVRVNSTDVGGATSACVTDASDLAVLSTVLGRPSAYSICFDYNESGSPVDASDLAYFAAALGAHCQ